LGGRAGAKLLANTDACDIAYPQRYAVDLTNDDGANIREAFRLTGNAHQPLGAIVFDVSRATISVVGLDGRHELSLGDPVRK
jgi:hypothetical protein